MNISSIGIILKTGNYQACKAFYKDVIGLALVDEKLEPGFSMAHFTFGSGYLLVETGGVASDREKSSAQNPSVIRLDVYNAQKELSDLKAKGFDGSLETYPWGTIVVVLDPDGNRVELKQKP